MSRVGEMPVSVPAGVKVSIAAGMIEVSGKNGKLQREVHPAVDVEHKGDEIVVQLREKRKEHKRYHGLMRTLINNMVVGVTAGFSKELVMVGVGYRATMKGKVLHLNLGFSHPVEYTPIEGVGIQTGKQNNIIVSGANKEHVGQVAAIIRSFRKPEPYHGKGVRYKDEVIATKVGKSSGKK